MKKAALLMAWMLLLAGCWEDDDLAAYPPRIRPMAVKTLQEGQAVSFDLVISDPNHDPVTVQILGKLPNGAYFAGKTFTWAPTYEDSGQYKVVFQANTPDGQSDTESVLIIVKNVVSLSFDLQPIFTHGCLPCHGAAASEGYAQTGGPGKGLDLRDGKAWASLVNVRTFEDSLKSPQFRVKAGDAAESYLLQKVDTSLTPKSGRSMPFGDSTLAPGDVDLVRQWIAAGAPDN